MVIFRLQRKASVQWTTTFGLFIRNVKMGNFTGFWTYSGYVELTSIVESFQDVIHCIGGVQVLFPWLEYAGKLPIKSDKRISIAPSSVLQSDIYNNLQDDWVVVQSATYVGTSLS